MAASTISTWSSSISSGGYAVRPIDGLDVAPGRLVGPSGCGKTTLLSCLGGIRPEVRPPFDDVDTTLEGAALAKYRRDKVGSSSGSTWFPSLPPLENVMALLRVGASRAARKRAEDLLDPESWARRTNETPPAT